MPAWCPDFGERLLRLQGPRIASLKPETWLLRVLGATLAPGIKHEVRLWRLLGITLTQEQSVCTSSTWLAVIPFFITLWNVFCYRFHSSIYFKNFISRHKNSILLKKVLNSMNFILDIIASKLSAFSLSSYVMSCFCKSYVFYHISS